MTVVGVTLTGMVALTACSDPDATPPPTSVEPSPSTSSEAASEAVTLRGDPIDGVSLTSDGELVDGATTFTVQRPDSLYAVTALPLTETTVIGDTTFEPSDTGQRVIVQVQPSGTPTPRVEPATFAAAAEGAAPVELISGDAVVTVVLIEGGTSDDLAVEVTFDGRADPYALDGAWLGDDPEPLFFSQVMDVDLTDASDDPLQAALTGGVVLTAWDISSQVWADDGNAWLIPSYSLDASVPSQNYEVTGGTVTITIATDRGDFDFTVDINENGSADEPDPIQVPADITTVETSVEAVLHTRNPATGNAADDHTLAGRTDTVGVSG